MPRLKKMLTPEEEFTAGEIKKDFGAMLSVSEVARYCGFSEKTARRWLSDVDSININGKRRYMAADLARKIERGRERA